MSTPSEARDKKRRPYFTLTNEYPRHRKIRGLSDKAFRLHVTLIALCNEDRNDGLVLKGDLNMLGAKAGKELLDAGLVHEHPQGFQMHDYLDHQKSAAQIEELISKKAESGALGGRVGMHERWHIKRDLVPPSTTVEECPLCQKDARAG